MKVGISSASFYPYCNTEDAIELMKKIGFDLGEIFLNCPSEYEEKFASKLAENMHRFDFEILSVHGFSASFEPYLFDSYKRRIKDMMNMFTAVVKAAKIMGAKFYTFHGMRLQKLDTVDMKHVSDIYEMLSYTASEHGVKLCQENVSWCMSGNISFLKLLQEMCKEPIYFTLDIKQAYKAGIEPCRYIDVMGHNLMNLHLNDRNEKNVCLLPGKGSVDFEKIKQSLDKVNYSGSGIIEVYKENYNNFDELYEAKQYIKKYI